MIEFQSSTTRTLFPDLFILVSPGSAKVNPLPKAKPMPKLTIIEIAQLAGVSIGTVSRALNGRPGISQKTRTAIMEIVKQTGFAPNVSARRLVQGTRQLVGVAPFSQVSVRSPYYAYLLDGIQERLYQKGFVARVLDTNDAQALRECSGFIVPGIHLDDPRVKALQKRGMPVVVVGRSDGNVSWVDADSDDGIRVAMEHLIKLGHRQIAHLTGSPIGQSTQVRLERYRSSLEAANLKYDPSLVFDGGFTDLGAYRAVREVLERSLELPFTAINAASDEMAIGAILAITDLGLQVPRDICVTGFDDLPLAKLSNPPLTTVRQPIREAGHIAADLLLKQFEGLSPQQLILPVELIVRSSSGPLVDHRTRTRTKQPSVRV
jgi:LacI family transcriptional regulator